MILELLAAVGLVVRDSDGKFRRAATSDAGEHAPAQLHKDAGSESPAPPAPPAATNAMSLNVSITVPMDQISRWGSAEKVQKFFAEWANLLNAKVSIEKMISEE